MKLLLVELESGFPGDVAGRLGVRCLLQENRRVSGLHDEATCIPDVESLVGEGLQNCVQSTDSIVHDRGQDLPAAPYFSDRISQMELHPLVVTDAGRGVTALDARVIPSHTKQR